MITVYCYYYVKSVRIRSYSGPHFPLNQTRITPNTETFNAVILRGVCITLSNQNGKTYKTELFAEIFNA